MTRSTHLNILCVFWATLECLGYGGLLYGWGSLLYVLKDEGLHLDLCNDRNTNTTDICKTSAEKSGTIWNATKDLISDHSSGKNLSDICIDDNCDVRLDRLDLTFTLASFLFCGMSFVLGIINLKFGTRVTRLTGALLFVLGSLLIAFTTNETTWPLIPGLCLISGGGIACLITNMQLANLFPNHESTICGFFNGAFDASAGVMWLIKLGYENGIRRRTSFLVLSGSHLMTLFSTFLILPKNFITHKEVLPIELRQEKTDTQPTEMKIEENTSTNSSKPSLKSCIQSPIYIVHIVWFAILFSRFTLFVGLMNEILEEDMDDDDDVIWFIDIASYLLMCGFFISPFAGFICDLQSRMFIKRCSQFNQILRSTILSTSITTTLGVLMFAFLFMDSMNKWYAVLVLMVLFRSFVFNVGASFIATLYPAEYFGILYGIMILFGGVFNLSIYPLALWSHASGFEQVNVFNIAIVALNYSYPIYLWWKSCREEPYHT